MHAAVSFRVGSQVVPSGSQRYAGQQSSTAVPIHSFVPAGQAGAGVLGHDCACGELQSGWQVKCGQQSDE